MNYVPIILRKVIYTCKYLSSSFLKVSDGRDRRYNINDDHDLCNNNCHSYL